MSFEIVLRGGGIGDGNQTGDPYALGNGERRIEGLRNEFKQMVFTPNVNGSVSKRR